MDRYKTYDVRLVKVGKLDIVSLNKAVDKSRFNKSNVISSDSDWSLSNLFKEMGLVHKTFKTGNKVYSTEGIYHVNTLNNFVGRTREWLKYNFHSVSTKYLAHYLNWYVMLQILKRVDGKNNKLWDYALNDTKAFDRNRETEKNYRDMLELSNVA